MSVVQSIFTTAALSLLLLSGCDRSDDLRRERGLYEWRSTAKIEDRDYRQIDSLGVTRLFVRFFDVQRGEKGEPVPRSVVRFSDEMRDDLEIVPTVYITNELMKSISSPTMLDSLAVQIVRKVEVMHGETGTGRMGELQIDCDWSASSRAHYFSLLASIDRALPESTTLSATIRLHQVKYRVETGVPPVDRGLLMVYNTGEVTSPSETNSILDRPVVEEYIDNLGRYPLRLDVALPIFSWGVRFHYGRFAELLPDITGEDLQGRPADFRQVAPERWQVLRVTEVEGARLEPGDEIRVEESPPEEVLPVAQLIADRLKDDDRTVILYRYDPLIFQRYETTRLLPLYRAFD